MNTSKNTGQAKLIIILIVIVLISYLVFNNLNNKPKNKSTAQQNNQPIENDPIENNFKGYVDYSSEAIATATKNDGKALLFFHADWCPTCISAEKNILKNLDQIPDNLTIIKTDYDSQTDLKKKYSITYQHTFVQVRSDGELITKWNGGGLDEILKRVK